MTKEKEITVKRWKFNVINERGFEESWTGSFDSKEKMACSCLRVQYDCMRSIILFGERFGEVVESE